MRARLVAGNWKMYGSLAANRALLDAIVAGVAGGECAVCVPFPYLAQARERLQGTRIALAAQTVSQHASGAFTGEVSGAMLAEFGCRYVLVGHSERRQLFGETDETAAARFAAAQDAGLTPILCVGETLEERESQRTEAVVVRQLQAVMRHGNLADAVLAYEPVWAIGTGRNATPAQAGEAHAHIRSRIRQWFGGNAADQCHIIYGGSVKPDTVRELAALPDVDGALVGGASLEVRGFFEIVSRSRPAAV
jgi:triosephosphate isomerase